ncbi:hypothetical protein B0I35DRAFT_410959 [Stachybotrys elegans]|uniref:SMODS and SLOG-associating 2TM effector domain-containing protein n=1 Tax=Stachybotrys elegans TaxID=80388 RepID=A0A8K0WN70_9HYPO|nr:hypothetical protein B0I35DRAFT_410959 [Stachybotrys elegans]
MATLLRRDGFLGKWVRTFVSPYDEEQGYPAPGTDGGVAAGSEKPLNVATTSEGALIPQRDKLLVFRALTGIDTVPALTRAGHSRRLAPNRGIYNRVVRAEQQCGMSYHITSTLINVCLGTQIVVAAILTALGAADGPHTAVTAFGAINTIIAGILTYVKGSGLPDRLKHHKEEWKRIREHIEQREREFCLADCPLDAYEEVQIVEEMYRSVKARLEAGQNPSNSGGTTVTSPSEAAPGIMRSRSVLSPTNSTVMRPHPRPESRPDHASIVPRSDTKSTHDVIGP